MINLILDRCLEEIRAGRATVADCLAEYPDFEDELEPLLRLALQLGSVPDIQPSTAFRLKTRARLLSLPDPPPAEDLRRRLRKRGRIPGVARIFERLKRLLRGSIHAVTLFL